MDLNELRQRIDEIDDSLVDLIQRRMGISAEIALYKQANNMPVYDPERERQKLLDLSGKASDGCKAYINALYTLMFELSRAEQEKVLTETRR